MKLHDFGKWFNAEKMIGVKTKTKNEMIAQISQMKLTFPHFEIV